MAKSDAGKQLVQIMVDMCKVVAQKEREWAAAQVQGWLEYHHNLPDEMDDQVFADGLRLVNGIKKGPQPGE